MKKPLKGNLKNLLCIIPLCTSLGSMVYGQSPQYGSSSLGLSVPTPNAAALARYGEVPVNLAYGIPDISVPLHAVNYDGINVPISLKYHASGIGTEDFPGWVGLGWSLDAGGQITRVIHNGADEYKRTYYNNTYLGYYFGGNVLNTASWNTSPPGMDDGEPDEFIFNFGNYSGSFYRSEHGTWEVKSTSNASFEIQEELNTGDFILNSFDQVPNNKLRLNSIFLKFTITDPMGYKYVFGGNENSIEFSRGAYQSDPLPSVDEGYAWYVNPTTWYLTKIINPTGSEINFTYKKGEVIFKKFSSYDPNSSYRSWDDATCSSTGAASHGGVVLNPVYLDAIETPRVKVAFDNGASVQLQYTNKNQQEGLNGGLNFSLMDWPDINQYVEHDMIEQNGNNLNTKYTMFPAKYYKELNQISVIDKTTGTQMKNIVFNYSENPAVRLTLLGVDINEGASYTQGQKYTFEYNNIEGLPPYRSMKSDFWGYYNGVDYLNSSSAFTYPAWRPVNPVLCQYGIIKKINYPTGGSTAFQFESNDYSSYIKFLPSISIVTNANNQSQLAGGLRIKAVTSIANFSSIPITKEYKYVKNYSTQGNISSGCLNGEMKFYDMIKYTNSCTYAGTGGYMVINSYSDNSVQPLSQIGGPSVLYSEVTEKLADNSYTVNNFTNFESPSGLDELSPLFAGALVTDQNSYMVSSMDLERGLAESIHAYNSSNQLVSEKLFTYNTDINRKNNYVRAQKEIVTVFPGNSCEMCPENTHHIERILPYKIYYYPNYLTQEIERDYTGSSSYLENITQYNYDQYRNVVSTTTIASDGKKIVQKTKYNSNPSYLQYNAVAANAVNLRKLFYQYKIKSYPIETTTSILPAGNPTLGSERITAGTLYEFTQDLPIQTRVYNMELSEPFYPVTYTGGGGSGTPVYHYTSSAINSNGEFVADERYKIQSTINTFTTNASGSFNPVFPVRPLNISTISGDFAYTWDHNMQYLTSKTQNTPLNNFVSGSPEFQTAFTSFEGNYFDLSQFDDNRGNWNFDKNLITDGGVTGKKYISLFTGASNDEIVSTFVLKKYKKYTLSFWAKGTFPQLFNGTTPFGAAYLQNNSWRYYEFEVTGDNQPLVIKVGIGGGGQFGYTTYLDEVRLYPADAIMQSYTYNSLGNVTSIDDGAGKITFYEYDILGRLITVKDQDGNILQNTGYTIKGAQ